MHVTVLSKAVSFEKNKAKIDGLAIHIQTHSQSILFNVGLDGKIIQRAEQLGITLAKTDIVILSGPGQQAGLEAFLKCNCTARFYILDTACEEYEDILTSVTAQKQIQPVKDSFEINDDIFLFSSVGQGHKLCEKGTGELHLIVTEEKKRYLFVNYALHGTVNILEEAEIRKKGSFCGVIGGFYFYNQEKKEYEEDSFITLVVALMKKKETLFYTSHETGEKAFGQLKDFMQNNMRTLEVNQSIEF